MKHGNRRISRALALAVWSVGTVTTSGSATAHHSAAMFDDTQCRSIEGTVRNFQWQYPHSWLWIIVSDNSGADDIWGFEMPAPSALTRSPDWTRHVLPKGDKVAVKFSPLRNGQHAGLANAIILSSGKVLHAAPNAFACEKELWKQAAGGSAEYSAPK
jgi:hypothetical protein